MRTLILGGARSGKSSYAESIIGSASCLYVATARPYQGEFDADFQSRIAHHVQRRPQHWLLDDANDLVDVLKQIPGGVSHVLVDDLGTWVSHLLDTKAGWDGPRGQLDAEFAALIRAIRAVPEHIHILIVSPEVGMGIIPEHASGRLFRDEIGTLNQQVAAVCEHTYFVLAGKALELS